MAKKMIAVIAFDVDDDDPGKLQDVMEKAKPIFETEMGLKLYAAIDETAEAIIGFLTDGLPEPVEP
jgi:hypothetical protein